MLHVLFPLTLNLMYLGIKCWNPHILLNRFAVLALRNYSLVFL